MTTNITDGNISHIVDGITYGKITVRILTYFDITNVERHKLSQTECT